jgi:hypothetical protein
MSDDNVAQFGAVALRQRRQPAAPGYREVTVAGRVYRVVADPAACNGHRWHLCTGSNGVGGESWAEVQAPAQRDVIAALIAS